MARRLPHNAKGIVRERSQERPESHKLMGNGVSWWLWSKSEAMRIELQSQMLSRMLVLKKSLAGMRRGGQNRAGIQRKGAAVTGCPYSAHKQGCSSDLFRSAQSCEEINVMHFRVNILILVLSLHWAIEIERIVWRELTAQLEHDKNAQRKKLNLCYWMRGLHRL